MEVVILESVGAIGELAAEIISSAAKATPTITLGLATGGSALPTYQALAERHRVGGLGFNEPASSLASRTRPKTLMTQTRHDNA